MNNFHVDTFRDAMSAIDEGSADYAVLPIENSTAGIVSEIYDLLAEYENLYCRRTDHPYRALPFGRAWGKDGGYQKGIFPSSVFDAKCKVSSDQGLAAGKYVK